MLEIPPVSLVGVEVQSVALSARLHIDVNSPTRVRVRYAPAGGGDTLEVSSVLTPTDSVLTLTRLIQGRSYRYTAEPVSVTGTVGPEISGQFVTPPLPSDLADLDFGGSGSPSQELFVLEVRATSGFSGFVALDRQRNVVWYFRTVGGAQGAAIRANGNFVVNDGGHGLREVTPSGEVVHRLDEVAMPMTAHHDVIVTPNNTVLFIARDVGPVERTPRIFGEAIYEWTPETGDLRKRWSSWDWLDPAVDWSERSTPSDWLHANSLSLGPHGNYILSLNWLSEVISIAPDWSHLEWRLGGEKSDFVVDSDAVFTGQHTASMPAEGRVLMFDNGRDLPAGRQYSRALELQLDPVAHRAHRAWTFLSPTGNYAPYLSLARRLANGNTVTCFGLPTGEFNDRVAAGPISAFEVTPAGAITWTLVVNDARSVYRGWPLSSIGGERLAH